MNFDFEKLVKLVAEKAAITPDQARKAVTIVVDQLKDTDPKIAAVLAALVPSVLTPINR